MTEITELAADASGHGWDEFVERHPGGSLFHLSLWRDVVCRHFRHRPRFLEARHDGRRVGVLPLYEIRSLLTGHALVSVPYGVYGGPLATTAEAAEALLAALHERVAAGKMRFAELRCADLSIAGAESFAALPGSDLYSSFVRELPADPEECLGLIPRKSRASTRQARDKHGLTFVEDPRRLDDFYRLFVLNKQRLGSPSFSREWFSSLLGLPGRRVRLHLVLQGKQVLVAVLSFLHGDTWNPYYSGSTPEADRLSASNFTYWQLMRTASEEGFRRFDFGRSRVDTGPFHFKRNMGFEPRPLPYRYVLGAGQRIPSVNPGNAAFSLPRRVIQKLPFDVACAVGPVLMSMVP